MKSPPTSAPFHGRTEDELAAVLGFLLKSHLHLRGSLPQLMRLAENVVEHHVMDHPELDEIWTCAARLNSKLLIHMDKEEKVLFPRIERLLATLAPVSPEPACDNLPACIEQLAREHAEIETSLSGIRHASDGYRLPEGACTSWRNLYRQLETLEAELHRNFGLEENILIPLAARKEAAQQSLSTSA